MIFRHFYYLTGRTFIMNFGTLNNNEVVILTATHQNTQDYPIQCFGGNFTSLEYKRLLSLFVKPNLKFVNYVSFMRKKDSSLNFFGNADFQLIQKISFQNKKISSEASLLRDVYHEMFW